MTLFEKNCDIEGVDVKNACYGGTQALFHAIDWIHANWEFESQYFVNIAFPCIVNCLRLSSNSIHLTLIFLISERYAIAVMADIAVYGVGPARCTGGMCVIKHTNYYSAD